MYPRAFRYQRATSVEHAVALLHQYGEEARLLAGGASLIQLMKLRLVNPSVLIDIGRLDTLAGSVWAGDRLVIGALVRHADVADDAEIAARLPLLRDVAAQIGDVQIRNMGTLGGALAETDPAGDWGPALLALGGMVHAMGPAGERTIAADDFFVDAYTTALAPDEVLVAVTFPLPAARAGSAHLKFEVRAGDFAVANCSPWMRRGAARRSASGLAAWASCLCAWCRPRRCCAARSRRPSALQRRPLPCASARKDLTTSAARRPIASIWVRSCSSGRWPWRCAAQPASR